MDIIYKENILSADDVLLFQKKMGWTADPREQWEKSLRNTVYSVAAIYAGEIIAMGRLLGDAAIYWYVNDVYVINQYQGKGIGRKIMIKLLAYARQNSLPGTEVSVCLMCAQGKEGFYEKFGFRRRPHEHEGAGMELEMVVDFNATQ